MQNLLVLDDHKLARDGLKYLLLTKNIPLRVYDCDSIAKVKKIIDFQPFDLFVSDMVMPDGDGFEAVSYISAKCSEIKLIFLTMLSELEVMKRAMQMNIHGYLLKSDPEEEIIEAFLTVMQGGKYFSKRVKEILAKPKEVRTKLKPTNLFSPRERIFLFLLNEGMDFSQISIFLKMSPKMIQNLESQLIKSLNLNQPEDLIHFARKWASGLEKDFQSDLSFS